MRLLLLFSGIFLGIVFLLLFLFFSPFLYNISRSNNQKLLGQFPKYPNTINFELVFTDQSYYSSSGNIDAIRFGTNKSFAEVNNFYEPYLIQQGYTKLVVNNPKQTVSEEVVHNSVNNKDEKIVLEHETACYKKNTFPLSLIGWNKILVIYGTIWYRDNTITDNLIDIEYDPSHACQKDLK